jgi:hypothetical protein
LTSDEAREVNCLGRKGLFAAARSLETHFRRARRLPPALVADAEKLKVGGNRKASEKLYALGWKVSSLQAHQRAKVHELLKAEDHVLADECVAMYRKINSLPVPARDAVERLLAQGKKFQAEACLAARLAEAQRNRRGRTARSFAPKASMVDKAVGVRKPPLKKGTGKKVVVYLS